jgi:hypothetical protein
MLYLALPVSSGRFIRAIRVSNYSGVKAQERRIFNVRGHYPLGRCFPATSAIFVFCNSCRTSTELLSYYPTSEDLVWAVPVSLAATQGIARVVFHPFEASNRQNTTRYCFLFLQVLRCFTSLGSLLYTYDRDDPYGPGFPIRTFPDQRPHIASPEHFAD